MATFEESIDKYVKDLMTSDALCKDGLDMNAQELVETWVLLKYLKEQLDKRLKDLRSVLLTRTEEHGHTNDKGGQRLVVQGTTILREKRQDALPSEKAIRDLLKESDIPLEKVFSKVTNVVLDSSKLLNLITLGKLDEEDVNRAKRVTWALRVRESAELTNILEERLEKPDEETDFFEKPRRTRSKRLVANGSRKGE